MVDRVGFHVRRLWRKPLYVPYASIHKIVAWSGVAGHGEIERTLYIHASAGRIRLLEPLYRDTELVSHLQALPGFDHHAWRISASEDTWGLQYWGRRTVLLTFPKAKRKDR